jgi:chemotaxis protein MotB
MTIDTPFEIELIDAGEWHGGAWKVAYADFVTAMMAFFLLMWLLNATTEEQKNAISNYFDPTIPKVSDMQSGAGGVLGGLTMTTEGSMTSNKSPIVPPKTPNNTVSNKVSDLGKSKANDGSESVEDRVKEVLRQKEQDKFEQKAEEIRQAIQDSPELAAMAENLKVDVTPEGLRIQIIDQDGKPMFPSGSAKMFAKTKNLMGKIGDIIKGMPNELSIRGHTDSVPYGKGGAYTNWELSSDRANSTRRALKDSGIPADRLNNVMGKADTEPLIKENPADAQNRRITIMLLKEELTNPNYAKQETEAARQNTGTPSMQSPSRSQNSVPIGTFKKTPGKIEFP